MHFSQQFNKEDDLCLLQLKLQESSELTSRTQAMKISAGMNRESGGTNQNGEI